MKSTARGIVVYLGRVSHTQPASSLKHSTKYDVPWRCTCFGWQNQLNGDANGCVVSPGEIHLLNSAVRRRDDGHRVISGLFTRGVVRTGQLGAATYSHLLRGWTPISPSLTWDLSSGERWSAPLRRKIGRWRSSCRGIFLAHFARVQLARGYQPARATVAASALLHREHIDSYVYLSS